MKLTAEQMRSLPGFFKTIHDPRRAQGRNVSAISTAPCRRDNSQFFRSNIPGQERLVVLQH